METQQEEQNNGGAESLRRPLALAIKSIDWSYAIFWSISSRQPGVLEWGEGYYNGDIKTRKTIQAGELSADQLGLQRTEQLRELYESLSAAESNPQAKRPSAALSPEDLTDTEWYFLVCMSFIFNIGQGLPGRSLAKNQTMWLCNAHQADSKVFTRSLLAKSAAIQTVICFPYLGGVVELGVTELVPEDRNLIEHIKKNFLDNPNPIISIAKYEPSNTGNDRDVTGVNLDENAIETDFSPVVECDDVQVSSPNSSTNGSEFNEEREESHMVEDIHEEASQVQSWQFIDDELSNYVHNSMNSSDCISQTPVNPRRTIPLYKEKVINGSVPDLQECSRQNLDNVDPQIDDEHYQTILATLLKSSHQLILGPYFRKNNRESSFVNWKKERSQVFHKPRGGTSQRMLKKALFEVVRMHGDWLAESRRENGEREKNIWKPEADEIDKNHVMAERKRREKLNERFTVLGSLVPSTGKADKISILDDTIEYLKDLERRVEELEGRGAARRKPQEAAERISVSYGTNRIANSSKKSSPFKKRKASDLVEDMEHETDEYCRMGESSSEDLTVSIIDKNVSIEINCAWRESLLLEIMDAVSDLNLESQAVQSSNTDGIFSLTIKSKFKGSKVSSASMIRQALQRVIRKS